MNFLKEEIKLDTGGRAAARLSKRFDKIFTAPYPEPESIVSLKNELAVAILKMRDALKDVENKIIAHVNMKQIKRTERRIAKAKRRKLRRQENVRR